LELLVCRAEWPVSTVLVAYEVKADERRSSLLQHGLNIGSTHKEKPDVITQYHFLNTFLKAHAKTERGAAMVEYALLVALIAIVAIAALKVLGQQVSENFSEIDSDLDSAQ